MSVKRLVLTLAILSILGAVLAMPSARAHAQVTQQTVKTVSAYSDSYAFNAGVWGWGVCLGHNAMQSIHNAADLKDLIVAAAAFKFSGPMLGFVAASSWLYVGAVTSKDRGQGVCMAWPFYLPSPVPITWSR